MKRKAKKKFNYKSSYIALKKEIRDLNKKFDEICVRFERVESLCESASYAKEVAIFHRHNEDGRVILP